MGVSVKGLKDRNLQLGRADCGTTLPVTSGNHKQSIFPLNTFILAAQLGTESAAL
jgi:hypothetical protein